MLFLFCLHLANLVHLAHLDNEVSVFMYSLIIFYSHVVWVNASNKKFENCDNLRGNKMYFYCIYLQLQLLNR